MRRWLICSVAILGAVMVLVAACGDAGSGSGRDGSASDSASNAFSPQELEAVQDLAADAIVREFLSLGRESICQALRGVSAANVVPAIITASAAVGESTGLEDLDAETQRDLGQRFLTECNP